MFEAAKSKKEQEENPEKTLDLLDELLYTIHSTRMTVLMGRTRKYEKRMAKRKEKANMSTRRNRGTFVNETEADEEVNGYINNMANEFSAPSPVPDSVKRNQSEERQKSTMNALSGMSIGKSATEVQSDNLSMKSAANAVKSMLPGIKKKAPTKSKLFQGSASTYNPPEELSNDMQSVKIFGDFKQELEKWFEADPVRRNNIESRGEMADYLVEKYLCQRLDPLPPSKTVSSCRKNLSKIVEELASSSGNLPSDWCATAFDLMPESDKEHMKATRQSNQGAIAEMKEKQYALELELREKAGVALTMQNPSLKYDEEDDDTEEAGDGRKSVKFANSNEARKEAEVAKALKGPGILKKDPQDEKDRIKRQYEQYHRKKKEIDLDGAPDTEKAKQHEDLQSEIRALLAAVQTK
jgi:hypothetical protein